MSGGARSSHVRHDMDQPIKVRQANQYSYLDQQNIDFYGAYGDEYPKQGMENQEQEIMY